MVLQVLTVPIYRAGYRNKPIDSTLKVQFGGGTTQRGQNLSRRLHSFSVPVRLDADGWAPILAFGEAHGTHKSFLWQGVEDWEKVRLDAVNGLVPLDGVVDGVNKVFTLPKINQFGGDYFDPATLHVFVDAVEVTIDTSDRDTRTITLDAGPVVQPRANYEFHRRVVFEEDPSYAWRKGAAQFPGTLLMMEAAPPIF